VKKKKKRRRQAGGEREVEGVIAIGGQRLGPLKERIFRNQGTMARKISPKYYFTPTSAHNRGPRKRLSAARLLSLLLSVRNKVTTLQATFIHETRAGDKGRFSWLPISSTKEKDYRG